MTLYSETCNDVKKGRNQERERHWIQGTKIQHISEGEKKFPGFQ